MIVEYIQPVCPYCGYGVYRATIDSSTDERYYCQMHGDIERGLVQFVRCERHGDTVIMPGRFLSAATNTDTSGGSRIHWDGSTVYHGRRFTETTSP